MKISSLIRHRKQSDGTQVVTSDPLLPTIDRLDDALILRQDRLFSWVVTILIGALAFTLRIVNLARPKGLVFDETYYAKDAWTLLHLGYETSWPQEANESIEGGFVDIYTDQASFVVHPQLGKWLIAAGEHLFGMNSFGWRISALVFGVIMIMATIRMARRLSRSTLIGALAGFFLTVDGLTFVMSRLALLDIFETSFTVMAVACVIADRDWFRHRLAEHLRRSGIPDLQGGYGPWRWWRPWRFMAGIYFGLAIGCKWNALYVLAAMGIVSVILDHRSRVTAGAGRTAIRSFWREAPLAFVYLVVSAVGVYIASWASWLAGSDGWGRQWGVQNPDHTLVRLLGPDLGALAHYHQDIWNFHTGDWISQQSHTYEAHPATWPVVGRVIGIDAVNGIQPGVEGCAAEAGDTCLRVISGIGTPFLWWFAAAAMVIGVIRWLVGREVRFAIPVIAALVPWLAWFPNADRPLFFFYAIMMIPFTATVLAMVLGLILGPDDHPHRARRAIIVGAVVVIIVLNFWFIYPILTDELLTRTEWSRRMWFRSWI